jgi:hypothetical protein
VLGAFKSWRDGAGARPLLEGADGAFDPVPKVTAVTLAKDAPEGAVRWWSEIDRAQFHLAVEELDAVASSALDWTVKFHAVVTASGAREGTW